MYSIYGIQRDGKAVECAAGYSSKAHAFATATKRTTDIQLAGNTANFVRLEIRDASGNVVPEYAGCEFLNIQPNERTLALALLEDCDDVYGVNEKAWGIIRARLLAEGGNDDIIRCVREQDGKFYLRLPIE